MDRIEESVGTLLAPRNDADPEAAAEAATETARPAAALR